MSIEIEVLLAERRKRYANFVLLERGFFANSFLDCLSLPQKNGSEKIVRMGLI